MDKSPLRYREIWNRKPSLQSIYNDVYRRIVAASAPGLTLEIGAGSGNFKPFAPNTVSSDIIQAPWLDLVCDAQRLPFGDATFANVVMIDVLHHVGSPLTFLQEAERVLLHGGRLIFCEPAITPVSAIFYRWFHEEPVDMSADPLSEVAIASDKDPWDSNQAIPTLLVGKYRDAVARKVPGLTLERLDLFSFLAYPLSGGFQPWNLLPRALAPALLNLEWLCRGALGRLAAFRLLACYRRKGAGSLQSQL